MMASKFRQPALSLPGGIHALKTRSAIANDENAAPVARSISDSATIAGGLAEKAGSSGKAPNDNCITVAVRIRPPNEKELASQQAVDIVRALDGNVIAFDPLDAFGRDVHYQPGVPVHGNRKAKDLKFAFDHVFGPEASQKKVYESTAQPLIDAVFDGYNATVFAYGATGAGKTHTMLGYSNDAGVMVQTMKELFDRIEQHRTSREINVTISMLEIYNETVRDILLPAGMGTRALDIREDQAQGIIVSNLSEHEPRDADQVLALLAHGNKNRTVSSTDVNATSSRSHAVLQRRPRLSSSGPRAACIQIKIRQRDLASGTSAVLRLSKLSMIDLAGSERASATKNRGERLQEGANINKSLLALGNCINALGDPNRKGRHVPYRDSKLTRLLQDSLGGNCRTVMIANLSPAATHYEDTLKTLHYANRAKEIKMKVERNVLSVDYHVSQYTAVIAELKGQIQRLNRDLEIERTGKAAVAATGGLFDSHHFCNCLEQVQKLIKLYEELQEKHGTVWANAMDNCLNAWLSQFSASISAINNPVTFPLGPGPIGSHPALDALAQELSDVEGRLEEMLVTPLGPLDRWEREYLALQVSSAVTESRHRQLERRQEILNSVHAKALQQLACAFHQAASEHNHRPQTLPEVANIAASAEPAIVSNQVALDSMEAMDQATVTEAAGLETRDALDGALDISQPAVQNSSPGKIRSRTGRALQSSSPYSKKLRVASSSSVTLGGTPTEPLSTSAAPARSTAIGLKRPTKASVIDSRRQSVLPVHQRRQTLVAQGTVPTTAKPSRPLDSTVKMSRALSVEGIAADGPSAGTRLRRQTLAHSALPARLPLNDVANISQPTSRLAASTKGKNAVATAPTSAATTRSSASEMALDAPRRQSMLPHPQRTWR